MPNFEIGDWVYATDSMRKEYPYHGQIAHVLDGVVLIKISTASGEILLPIENHNLKPGPPKVENPYWYLDIDWEEEDEE
jgi:hypothetical protein